MATYVGQAIVKVTPNAEEFHADLQRKVEKLDKERKPKVNIDIEADITEVLEDMRDVSKAAEALEKKSPITLRVVLQDTGVKEGLVTIDRMSQDRTQTITSELVVDEDSINRANRDMETFQERNSITETWLTLETRGAERSFDEFRRRVNENFHVTPKMTVPSPSTGPRRPHPVVSQEEWNAINWLPKLYKKMFQQIEVGTRQIYDPYIRRTSQLFNATAKPFRAFREVANEATSVNDFIQKLDRNVKKFGAGQVENLIPAIDGFRMLRYEVKRSAEVAKAAWRGGAMSAKAPPGMSIGPTTAMTLQEIAGLRGELFKFTQFLQRSVFTPLNEKMIQPLGEGFRKVWAEVVTVGNGFKKMGTNAIEGFKGIPKMLSSIGPMAGKAMESARVAFTDFMLDGIIGMEKLFPSVAAALSGVATKVGDVAYQVRGAFAPALSFISRSFNNTFKPMIGRVRNFADTATNHFSLMGRKIGRSVSGLGTTLMKPFRAVTRTLGPVVSKSFGAVGLLASRALSAGLNNKGLFKVARGILGRMSGIFMGLTRLGMGAFAGMGTVIMQSFVPALMAALIGLGLMAGQAILGGILALGGAILSVAQGALLMAPALVAAAGISFAALKIGLEGVGDGVSAAFSSETVEEFEEAIAKLPASVQSIARAFREFKGPMDEMKSAVQDNLLRDLAPSISSAMSSLFPVLSEGLQGVATEWNGALQQVLAELASPEASVGLGNIMRGTQDMAREMQPVLANLVAAFGSLADQGSKFLAPMGKWIADASMNFRNWADGLREIDEATGISKFDAIMERAATNAGRLGDIFGGLFGTIGNLFAASEAGGGSMLDGMARSMRGLEAATERGTEGFEAIAAFTASAADAGRALGPLFSPIISIIGTAGSILMDFAATTIPGFEFALRGLGTALEPLEDIASRAGGYFGEAIASMGPALAPLGDFIAPLIEGLMLGLRNLMMYLGPAIGVLIEAFTPMADALLPVIGTLGSVLGSMVVAALPILADAADFFMPLIPVLGEYFGWIGRLFGALMVAIEPVTDILSSIMGPVSTFLSAVIDVFGNGLMMVLGKLTPYIQIVGDGLKEILHEALIPLLPFIIAVVERGFKVLGAALDWLLPLIPPIVDVIVSLAKKISNILITAIEFLLVTWDSVWPVLESTFKFLFEHVIAPLINFVGGLFEGLGSLFEWVITKVIGPILIVLGKAMESVGDVISAVIDGIGNMLDWLKDKFSVVTDAIGKIWSGIKALFYEPIEWVVDVVINKGFIGAYNWVFDKLGMEDKQIEAFNLEKPSTLAYASGGVLPGYTPGRDVHEFVSPSAGRLLLSGGEAIMRPEWTRAVGGPKAVEEMNRAARSGRINPPYQGGNHAHALGGVLAFAGGGVIPAMMAIVREKYPQLTMTSGQRPGGGLHGAGLATDWSNGSGNTPAQLALAQDIARTYPGSAELIYDAPGWSGNIKNGQNVGAFGQFYTMAQAGRHDHHVHWGMTTPPTMPFGGGVFEGGSDGSGGGIWSRVTQWLSDFTSKIWDGIIGPIKSQFSDYNKGWRQVVPAFGNQVFDNVKGWAMEKLGMANGGGGDGSVDISGISGPIVDQVQEVFARHGFTGADWDAAKWIIQKESNWNPTAVNPSSGAFGLFQFNPMGGNTLGQYLPDRNPDPAVQADAGARYMRNRYGSPTAAKAWWEQNNWYDSGGEAVGTGLMAKNVLTPERVLSPAQTAAFNDFVYRFMPELITQWKRNPRTLKDGFTVITGELKRIQKVLAEEREVNINKMSGRVKSMFEAQINGTKVLDDVNLEALKSLGEMSPADMESWIKQNGETLSRNVTGALNSTFQITLDPAAYLEAEKRAKEQIDKDAEEAKAKADEEADEAKQKAKEEADKARNEKEKAEDEAAKTDAEKEALKKAREAEREESKKSEEAIREEQRKKEQAEQKRIDELKETGEYYYGYKVLGDDGSNPNARELTREEQVMRGALSEIGNRVGLGGFTDKVLSRVSMVESIGQSVQTALPSWMAAAQGDYAGLNHNAAVAANIAITDATTEALNIIPTALGDLTEVIRAMGTPIPALHVEQLYTGMSRSEFDRAIDERMAQAARRGSGTTRPR